MKTYQIESTDRDFAPIAQETIDNLNKPKGSLGRLESLARQLCCIQHTIHPVLTHPCHILFGADHGIEQEGVSVSPREITWQQMINFTRGGGGINMFCRQHGFHLRIVDVGTDYDFSPELLTTDARPSDEHESWEPRHIINRKIAYGTNNFRYGPAMTDEQLDRALAIGKEMVDATRAEGCNIICLGEMGIANTSPSSIWMHFLTQTPLEDCVGAGAGLANEGVRHKLNILQACAHTFSQTTGITPSSTLATHQLWELTRWFGGFEMVAALGAMLRAGELKQIILVDGFIMSACMLMASKLYPQILDYAIFGHVGDESGHRRMLQAMHAQPLLHLGLRLGEGTGAICAYPLVVSAVHMLNEMDNFSHAQITKYF